MKPPPLEDWRDWILDAHRVIEEWEAQTNGRMLSMREAIELSERVARALQRAYERGRESV